MMINWRNQIVVLFATFLPWMGGVGVLIAQSPEVIFTPQDQERFLLIMKELSVDPQQSAGQAMASAGRELLGTSTLLVTVLIRLTDPWFAT